MSDLSTPLPQFLPTAAEAAPRSLSLPSRPLKIVFALAVALVGAYGVVADRQYVSTSHAVVSAYVLDVRTPIEGRLTGVPATAGDLVGAGEPLGSVVNTLTDHQHLDNLRITEDQARDKAQALAREHKVLLQLQQELRARAAVHTQAMGQRVGQQAEAARLVLAGKRAALAEADLELARGQKLFALGVVSRASFDKLRSAQQVLAEEMHSQEASYAALQTEQAALRQGILSEPGTNNDVSYSLQRADELAVKLAENTREQEAAEAEAQDAHRAAQAEALRSSFLDRSEIRAPSAGMVWKLHAVEGEHLATDSPVLSLVDCSRQFLIAEVPQDRASTLVPNGRVEVKLTGESGLRYGVLMTVSGRAAQELDGKLAAVPLHKTTDDFARAVIRLDKVSSPAEGQPSCLVGRTARVRLPTQSTNLVAAWLSQRL